MSLAFRVLYAIGLTPWDRDEIATPLREVAEGSPGRGQAWFHPSTSDLRHWGTGSCGGEVMAITPWLCGRSVGRGAARTRQGA